MARTQIEARLKALEAEQLRLQKEMDANGTRIAELRSLLRELEPAPVKAPLVAPVKAPVTGYKFPDEMFGVDLRPLDDQTRWQVMAGKREVIESLGGKPPKGSPCVVSTQT